MSTQAFSSADAAYSKIREMIVSLELRPGALISEKGLMDSLRIGRTPTREALRRLSQEQLVEVYPRRGMFVTSVEIQDLAALCDVRSALESRAARLAAERASDEERDELRALLDECDHSASLGDRALMDLDQRLHRTLYQCAHNRFLTATLEEYYALALRIWFLALDQARGLNSDLFDQRPILEAVITGDPDRAESLMRRHVLEFETVIHSVLLGRSQ